MQNACCSKQYSVFYQTKAVSFDRGPRGIELYVSNTSLPRDITQGDYNVMFWFKYSMTYIIHVWSNWYSTFVAKYDRTNLTTEMQIMTWNLY